MRLIIAGPGRAGGALALAAGRAGHDIVGVLARTAESQYGPVLDWRADLPPADVLFLAVRDDAINEVVESLVPIAGEVAVAAHLSGFVPISSLHPFQEIGIAVGGFHPLQSIPDPETGSRALAGAYVGVGGDDLATDTLIHIAETLEMEPFSLEDDSRPAYHAAAAAASNFVVTSLAVAADLFDAAGVDPKVSRPLVERAVRNVYELGADGALTGPIARGDTDTVIGHLTAAHDVSDAVGRQFKLMAEATTLRAGREEDLSSWR